MAAPTVARPDRPETLESVDGKLAQLAAFVQRQAGSPEAEAAWITIDRLLDVRLAIMERGEA